MRIAWKIILSTVMIVALALGLGGGFLVSAFFQTQLESEIQTAQQETDLLSLSIRALAAASLPEYIAADAERALQEVVQREELWGSYIFRVLDEDGVFYSNAKTQTFTGEDRDASVISSRVTTDSRTGMAYIQTTVPFTVGDRSYFVQTLRNVTNVFRQKDNYVRRFQVITASVILVAALVVAGITMFLTDPIRRLTRTTRQIADGQYSRRARVSSGDELGQLAADFNHMADALEAKIRELADAAQRQRDFTASFAHELKTPLTSVIGYADTLRSTMLPPDRQIQAANYIFSEGKRLEAMSLSLLDLFALEREAPVLRPVSAAYVGNAAARSAEYLMKEKKIRLITRMEDVSVLAEPALLQTMLYNLLDNARKASEPGTAVSLEIRRTETGCRVAVRDRGRGIPPEALGRITEPFFMVDKSRARAEGGAGLGLALCQRIAQAHGTGLHYTSQVGQGTTVEFDLKGAAE